MKVLLSHGTFTPVFAVVDDSGRPVRLFAPEERAWMVYHGDLAGLQARLEAFEARATGELAEAPSAIPRSSVAPDEESP